jgi:hypothetical protein
VNLDFTLENKKEARVKAKARIRVKKFNVVVSSQHTTMEQPIIEGEGEEVQSRKIYGT